MEWTGMEQSHWSKRPAITPPSTDKERKLRELLDYYQGLMLETLEYDLSEHPKWAHFRSRVLRIFGHRGLEPRLRELIKE